ncbi:LAQU0S01e09164g1_1 [Lachancea quebecensis]|uniref:LAQU0S01e09164g1_1 n=1 Tax=Lachancea quebecensis TaxID=1654605 RepID=A0A0P1KKZ2_9SACH|nr:LAQU0S01e09164g1_1 [Lachancea quebecensis]
MDAQAGGTVSVSVRLPHQKQEVQLNLLKSSNSQVVADILQFSPSTRCLTNLELFQKTRKLTGEEPLADLTNSDSLKLDVKFKPYTARDALRHVTLVRDTIGFTPETQDGISDFAISTGSQISSMPLRPIKDTPPSKDANSESSAFEISDEEKKDLQQTVKDSLSKRQTVNEILKTRSGIITPCLRSLALSAYNPVPPFYRTKGHLLYLHAITLENEAIHVTATCSGFYVNKSTSSKFDPNPRSDNEAPKVSLLDLFSAHSKKFKDHLTKLEKKVGSLDSVFTVRPSTTFLGKPWLVSTSPSGSGNHSRLQLSEADFNTERNFNDEFQAIKDMTSSDFQSIVDTEKLTAKVYQEFTETAVKDAMSIFYDDLVPMNPEAPSCEHIYLKNNIFYAFVGDVNGNYTKTGGDAAAFAASNQDLQAVKLLHRVSLSEIHYLLCVIIDFAGRRVLAQTPVPGLLSAMGSVNKKNPETGEIITEDLVSDVNVVYGLDEATGEVLFDEDFDEALESFSKVFHLKSHEAGTAKIKFSSNSKGIVGSDKRKYVLDLANSHPFDLQFARKYYDNVPESQRYPHRQTLVRNELVDKWWASKLDGSDLTFEKAFDEKAFAFNSDAYVKEGVEDPLVEEISNYLAEEVLPSFAKDYAIGNLTAPYDGDHLTDSMHKNGINMRYLGKLIELAENELKDQVAQHQCKIAEVAASNEEHKKWEKEYLVKVEKLIKERQAKINKLVQEGKDIPEDLKGNLKLDENDIRKPTKGKAAIVNKDQLTCLIKVSQLEIVARSLKHILREYTQDLPIPVLPCVIAYFFNLLFGSSFNENPEVEIADSFYSKESFSFAKLSRQDLLHEISNQAKRRFVYDLSKDVIEELCSGAFPLMRAISKKFGIQLLNKEYFFTQEQFDEFLRSQDKKTKSKIDVPRATFSINDLTLIPIVKDGEYRSLTGDNFWNQGAAILNEKEADGLVLLSQALTIKEEVNGVIHPSVAESYMAMSTIYHTLKRLPEALNYCRKACAIYERTRGVDSFEVLRCLTNLAILEISNKCPSNGALVLQRIMNTLDALCVAIHPAVINAYTMLQQASLASKEPKLAIEIMKKLSETVLQIENGERTIAYGYNQSRLGDLYATLNDLNGSLKAISEAREVFQRELGFNDETTAQCNQWVTSIEALMESQFQQRKLTQQQTSVNSSGVTTGKKQKASKKQEEPNPELANKSVDELLSFIEGTQSKSSKGKKKNKK